MKAKKYIKNIIVSVLMGVCIILNSYAMQTQMPQQKTFLQKAMGKLVTFGAGAAAAGSVAYNAFPKSLYNFLNPAHTYMRPGIDCTIKVLKVRGDSGIPYPSFSLISTPLSLVNSLRSALFSGTLHAANVRDGLIIAAGIAGGITALNIKRAGIPGIPFLMQGRIMNGEDHDAIDAIVNAPIPTNAVQAQQACDGKLAKLIKYTPYFTDAKKAENALKKEFLNTVPDDSTLTQGQKSALKAALENSDQVTANANTNYQKYVYFPVDNIAQNAVGYKKYPAKALKLLLRKPKKRDRAMEILNQPSYGAYAVWALGAGLIMSGAQKKMLNQSPTFNQLLAAAGIGLAGQYIYRRIAYPTRFYAAEKLCEIWLKKYQ